ncbi:MAG: CHAD domain-containing protein [Pseudomonadota bacterium]
MVHEIELKLELDAGSERRVRRHKWSGAFQGGRQMTRDLRTIYFDTADHQLAAAGLALRLRKAGRFWTQTVKIRNAFDLGLSSTTEHSCPAPGRRLALAGISDPTIRSEIENAIDGSVLTPLFETRITRTSRLVRLPGSVIEISVDIGEIATDEGQEPLREIELELVDGDPSQIFIVLKHLFPDGSLALSTSSKADRGYALITGLPDPEGLIPRRARRLNLLATDSIAEAIRASLRETCGQTVTNRHAAIGTMPPDVLKQLRIGLRRFRSALALFKKYASGMRAAHLNEEARWLASEIAKVRDLDVILNDILVPERQVSPDPGFEIIERDLHQRLVAARNRLGPLLKSARVQAFLIDMMAFSLTADFGAGSRKKVIGHAGRLLGKRWSKVRSCAENLETLSIEQRHDLRKQLKKMRYSIEFLRALYPDQDLKPFLKRLKRLQAIFGDLNDAAMVEEMFMAPDAPLADDFAAQRAVGRLIGSRMARAEVAWVDARTLWTDIDETAVFWR